MSSIGLSGMISCRPDERASSRSTRVPSGAITRTLPATGLTTSVKVNTTCVGGCCTTESAAGLLPTRAAWALAGAAGPATMPSRPSTIASSTVRTRRTRDSGTWRGGDGRASGGGGLRSPGNHADSNAAVIGEVDSDPSASAPVSADHVPRTMIDPKCPMASHDHGDHGPSHAVAARGSTRRASSHSSPAWITAIACTATRLGVTTPCITSTALIVPKHNTRVSTTGAKIRACSG